MCSLIIQKWLFHVGEAKNSVVAQSCEPECGSCPNIVLKAWRIPEKLLAFGLSWKLKETDSNVSKGVSNSHGIEELASKRRSKLVKSKIPSSISFLPWLPLKALPTLRVSLSTSKNTQKVSHNCAQWLLLSSFRIQPS